MKLYSMPSSGNSYKVRLLRALLGRRDIDLVDVEYGAPALQAAQEAGRLPFGKAPVLELDDGRLLPESNAILIHLGRGSRFMPADPVAQTVMLGWMFWEQNQHEGAVAVRAALRSYPHRRHLATPERMAELLERGHACLQVMEDRLAAHDWLVGDAMTLADICLFGYSHSAGSLGGFDMARFAGVGRWIARIEGSDGFEAFR